MVNDVIVSGYVSMDRVIKINSPATVGKTSIVLNKENADILYGGCSTNISYLLTKLNKKALPIIRLGRLDLESTGYYKFIQDEGVLTDAVEVIDDESTSSCYLILDENGNHITIFYPGAMDGKYSKDLDSQFFTNSKYAILTVGAYEDNVEFLKKCKMNSTPLIFGMKTDYEAFPEPLLKEILLYSKIIFTNESERDEIEKIFNLEDITQLFELGNVEVIVTTLGEKGSIYYTRVNGELISEQIPVMKSKVVDTTGCGDAYIAGFVFGLLEQKSIRDCCLSGSIVSSFIIEKMGCITNAPSKERFEGRWELIK